MSAGTPGSDEVDGVVEAWRRERPDLAVEPMDLQPAAKALKDISTPS